MAPFGHDRASQAARMTPSASRDPLCVLVRASHAWAMMSTCSLDQAQTGGLFVSTSLVVMSAQLAEQLLAVIWLDRCRQAQLLSLRGAHCASASRWCTAPSSWSSAGVSARGTSFRPRASLTLIRRGPWRGPPLLSGRAYRVQAHFRHRELRRASHFYMQRFESVWQFAPGRLRLRALL